MAMMMVVIDLSTRDAAVRGAQREISWRYLERVPGNEYADHVVDVQRTGRRKR